MGPSQCKTEFSWRATGAIGSADPLLRAAGYEVHGATRNADRCAASKPPARRPSVDVFDSAALRTTLARIRPRHVMHQLTDLALLGDPPAPARPRRNARIRDEGTRNLVAAALAAGSETLVAQSIDWICAAGGRPATRQQALDLDAQGDRRVSVMGVVALERQVLGAPGITGTVLRYGRLYGPGTGATTRPATNALRRGSRLGGLLALRHGARVQYRRGRIGSEHGARPRDAGLASRHEGCRPSRPEAARRRFSWRRPAERAATTPPVSTSLRGARAPRPRSSRPPAPGRRARPASGRNRRSRRRARRMSSRTPGPSRFLAAQVVAHPDQHGARQHIGFAIRRPGVAYAVVAAEDRHASRQAAPTAPAATAARW